MTSKFLQLATLLFIILIWIGCGSNADNATSTNNLTAANASNTTITEPAAIAKAPIVNIIDTVETNQTVLCMKDSAATEERMRSKMIQLYQSKLKPHIEKNKLNTQGQVAWVTQVKNAYFFEVGVALDKPTQSVGKNMFLKTIGEDSAYVAHFWGPQNLKKQGYDALQERMTDAQREPAGIAYEMYRFNFDSTALTEDAYKQETIIAMPYKVVKAKKVKEQSLLKTSKEMRKEAREERKEKKKN
jgi:hypothetical protein